MAVYTAIDDSEAYFNVVLYTGNAEDDSSTTQDITGVGFQSDMTWIESRTEANGGFITDSVRGGNKALIVYVTNAEGTSTEYLKSFASDGFQVGGDGIANAENQNYVSWNWKAGTTSGITTDGSTTITPSAYSFDQTRGISILTYTGNGTGGAKIAHGVGATPKMIVVKNLGATQDWTVFHQHQNATPEDFGLFFNSTAQATNDATYWNDGAPDSVNFTVGTNARTNTDSGTYAAYCFADVQGFSKFGGYTGNGADSGPFVFLGFRPAFLILKRTDSADAWTIFDNKRDTDNPVLQKLEVNTANAEAAGDPGHDFLSNGFKLRETGGHVNASGGTYIYMAFAEAPFVNSNGVPCNAR